MTREFRQAVFGATLRKYRTGLKLGVRGFADRAGLFPCYIVELESGRRVPRENVPRLAAACGLKKGTDEYRAFCERAEVAAGKIPKRITDNPVLRDGLMALIYTLK